MANNATLPGQRAMRPAAATMASLFLTRLLVTICLITVLATATPVVSWWAHAYSGPIEQPRGDVLILLSAANDDQGMISYSSYWRARYALLAWQTGGFQTIVVSGGDGPGILNFLVAEGVPRQAIMAEWQSTSTRESGVRVAHLLEGMPGKKVLLTSDFHMFRAIRVFRKLNIQVTPMPVPDALKSAQDWTRRLPAFETLLVESTKIVYYKSHGWI
jgi:uncharacterized SAM-binding protein YcdF (DUF218 family)